LKSMVEIDLSGIYFLPRNPSKGLNCTKPLSATGMRRRETSEPQIHPFGSIYIWAENQLQCVE
jgi:hypothetical protein